MALTALLSALSFCSLAALDFASAASASGTPGANVFAGNWSITVSANGTSAPGTLTLKVVSAASGTTQLQGFGGTPCAPPTTYYYGSFSIPLASATGSISGCTVGTDHLVARVNGGGDAGDGDVTFAAPNTFSGHLAYQGTSYPVNGTFSSHTADDGCCPGGTPPPSTPPPTPPPTTPPPAGPPTTKPPGPAPTPGSPSSNPSTPGGGQSPSPSTSTTPSSTQAGSQSSSAYSAPPGSGVVVAAEPSPGASATILSPNPLAATATTVALRVGDSSGDFPGVTIVGPAELRTRATGETLACWLIGPDAARVPASAYGKTINLAYFRGRLKAADAYTACAGVAQAIAATPAAPTAAANAPGAGCAAQRIGVAIQVKNGLIAAAQPVTPPGPGPIAVKYSCLRNADGTLKIAVSGAHQGVLRATLGPALRFAVVRAPDAATRAATIVFRFGPTWTGHWHSTHGAMRLTQDGAQVTGSYAACNGRATIAGNVSGSTFVGTWTEPCDSHSGRLHFTLAPDGQSFKGSWAYGRSAPRLTWSATRVS